jgi:hypothetical protein
MCKALIKRESIVIRNPVEYNLEDSKLSLKDKPYSKGVNKA